MWLLLFSQHLQRRSLFVLAYFLSYNFSLLRRVLFKTVLTKRFLLFCLDWNAIIWTFTLFLYWFVLVVYSHWVVNLLGKKDTGSSSLFESIDFLWFLNLKMSVISAAHPYFSILLYLFLLINVAILFIFSNLFHNETYNTKNFTQLSKSFFNEQINHLHYLYTVQDSNMSSSANKRRDIINFISVNSLESNYFWLYFLCEISVKSFVYFRIVSFEKEIFISHQSRPERNVFILPRSDKNWIFEPGKLCFFRKFIQKSFLNNGNTYFENWVVLHR